MIRSLLALALGLCASPLAAAQPLAISKPTPEEKGTYLGVLFGPVLEALQAHLPDLPRDQGVLVTFVLPDSPAAKAGLLRHDILMQYDNEKIRDTEHFLALISKDRPDRTVKLQLFRSGKPTTADATLALGPVLKIAQNSKNPPKDNGPAAAASKPAGPEAVSVAAKPLDGGQLKVTIEYYQENTGRLQTVNCSGTVAEIHQQIARLPDRVQPLAKTAFQRIYERTTAPKAPAAPSPPAPR